MLIASLIAAAPPVPGSVFGTVSPPPGVAAFDVKAGGGSAIGLLSFLSVIIRVATIVAGIWVMFQFVLAGYEYITANGDTGSHNKVKDRLTMSVMGLVLIVASYTIAALIGLIFFGKADFLLNPVII